MKVIWSPTALEHRKRIALFVARDDPDAAKRLVRIIEDGARKLAQFPNLGRPGRVPDTRELSVHKHYFIVYEISDNLITILAIWHTSMQYPPTTNVQDQQSSSISLDNVKAKGSSIDLANYFGL